MTVHFSVWHLDSDACLTCHTKRLGISAHPDTLYNWRLRTRFQIRALSESNASPIYNTLVNCNDCHIILDSGFHVTDVISPPELVYIALRWIVSNFQHVGIPPQLIQIGTIRCEVKAMFVYWIWLLHQIWEELPSF